MTATSTQLSPTLEAAEYLRQCGLMKRKDRLTKLTARQMVKIADELRYLQDRLDNL